ncbi:hypothetical protein SEA_AEGEUS_136 [Mycobacterium phage Aegeus]|nr:hypothetical protein SEA_BAUDELAIRE_136 [Mycobacterium phage Baudelaire]WKW86610.1 hypothetical protein SEA_AEGEUS_136 [Mycobacterium phage Aegeus]
MNANELADRLFGPIESLDPELAGYLGRDARIGDCIKHPLVYSIMHNERQNAMVNAQLAAKQEACEEAKNAGQWHQYVFLHERPWRVWALQEVEWDLPDSEYWPLIGRVWTDSENIWENRDIWEGLLTDESRLDRHLIMSQDERDALDALPSTLAVYRGYDAAQGTADGLSWTLDEDRARWFARRLNPELPSIITGTVGKADVIAHFTGRNEAEIVALPWTIDGKIVSAA